jgi:hypothetical protein
MGRRRILKLRTSAISKKKNHREIFIKWLCTRVTYQNGLKFREKTEYARKF